MAAMFKASNDNWQETQEKMAQCVFIWIMFEATRLTGLHFRSVPVYSNRGGRGGKPFSSRAPYQQPERPLPPNYVCYRCGKKGKSYSLFYHTVVPLNGYFRTLDTRLSHK